MKWYDIRHEGKDEKTCLKLAYMVATMRPKEEIQDRDLIVLTEMRVGIPLVSTAGIKLLKYWMEDELDRRALPWEEKRHC